jgi:hypothetical protein
LIRSVANSSTAHTTHIERGEPGLHRTPARTNYSTKKEVVTTSSSRTSWRPSWQPASSQPSS